MHAVLVDRPGPRLMDLLAGALDGSGPAIAPLDAGLPEARLDALIEAKIMATTLSERPQLRYLTTQLDELKQKLDQARASAVQ